MRKWNVAITYEPKITGVISGDISQTIRIGNKYRVGDMISFHGWEGRPYRSKWSFRTPYTPIKSVCNISMGVDGVYFENDGGVDLDLLVPWCDLDGLAKKDGIVPPTGVALMDVLMSGVKSVSLVDAQIIRW